jgi:hypothetical protein
MPSVLSSLGFPPDMDSFYQERLVTAALAGERLPSRDGTYVRWTPGAGVEMWLHVKNREVVGLSPHFAGSASMRIGITDRIARPEESPLAGGMRAWANPPGDVPEDGDYPFVFDLPDPDRFSSVALPVITMVQLAAFAHSLDHFHDQSAFDEAQAGAELKYAAESFIPSGTFVEQSHSPGAFALFAGRIAQVERLTNPFSNGAFLAVRINTLGGAVDAVLDPTIVNGKPQVDGIAQGSFWLSGRLPNDLADKDRSFWRRWLQG